ncbi:MAG: PAS domain-containing sensor histidine kinase [Deltaproteobacteria bacterium]|nr:PAS domain-containing sensor histidine kinase [Deltaproteobacteria bacterium]
MNATDMVTHYAPASCSPIDEIKADFGRFANERFFADIINYVPDIVIILNKNRQAVFANQALVNMLKISNPESIQGQRFGEILKCTHADESEGGCGTTEACRYCGAVNGILRSQRGENAIEECRILVKGEQGIDAMDLRVWATPFVHHDEHFTCFAAVNIVDEKQKLFMERIFLHDIMNTAAALRGFADLVVQGALEKEMINDFTARISFLSGRIIDEINAHRQIIAAENNELVSAGKELDSLRFITDLYNSYNRPDMLDNRKIKMDDFIESIKFTSDDALLSRVVGNMIKNALEASVPGETVTIGCFARDGRIHFWVHNPGYMAENIRMQVFNRSFSTKGKGRGLGTYSMKYLTEKYLHGQIAFTSSEDKGTTFTASYQLRFQ